MTTGEANNLQGEMQVALIPSPWRRPIIRAGVILLALVIAAAIWAKIALDRIERRGLLVFEAGVSLNGFLKNYVEAFKQRDVDALLQLYADDYSSENEGVWVEELQSERDGARVYEWRVANPRHFVKIDIRGQIKNHYSRIGSVDKAKFNISSIKKLDAGSALINCELWIRGKSPENETLESRVWFQLEMRSRDNCRWRISGKEMLFGQTVIGQGRGFTNITDQAGIDFQARHNPMLKESEWFPGAFGIAKYMSGGICAADYDNDDWIDLLFTDGGGTRLYRNVGGGNFRETTSEAGLPRDLKGGTVALIVDLDNDDDLDMLICRSTGDNLLLCNNGDGTFADVTVGSGVQGFWVTAAAAADYDGNGLVDIYLGRHLDPRTKLPSTSVYTRNGEGNSLLRNEGNLRFTDVTDEAGVRDGGLTLGVTWADYDDDGDQDVYLANDFGRNTLFQNQGNGTFSDVSAESGTIDIGYGMSCQFADIDNDGDLDIYTAGVHSAQRWLGNPATLYRYLLASVREGTIREDYPIYWELYKLVGSFGATIGEKSMMKGNSLLLNNGDSTFTDAAEEARVNPHGWYWSSCMFDFDNDTNQDIYTVNGWITGKRPDDL